MREDLRRATQFPGFDGRPCSVSACPLSRPSTCPKSVPSITNGSAKTSGANKTVDGYLIFIFYTVSLAHALSFLPTSSWLSLTLIPIFFSCSLYKVDGVYDRPPVRQRVGPR